MSASALGEEVPLSQESSPFVRWLMLAVLFAIPIIVTARPVAVPLLDPDIWWHLRVGEWVVQHKALPTNDPFTQEGRPWVAYSWLYEVTVYELHQAFGLAGIIGFRIALAVAIVSALYALVCRLERRFLVAVALSGVGTLAVCMLFSERPWLFTVLFSTLTLHAVIALRDGEREVPWWVWALPLVYALWANLHIQFVYGLFLLFLGCAVPVIEMFRSTGVSPVSAGHRRDACATRRGRQLVLLSGCCFAATFVNPYHVRIYGVILEYATQPGPFRWLSELHALEFREASDWVVLGLTGAACFMLGRRRLSLFEILLVAATAFFAFRARRDIWFVVLADLVVLASAGPREVPESQRYRPSPLACAGLLLVLLAFTAFLFRARELSAENLEAKVKERFPVEAVNFVRARGYFQGPLYNDFNWGGYLIWALPELPVAIDGRTNLHGDQRIERFGEVWAGTPDWHKDPDLSEAGVIIAPRETPLASLLAYDDRFLLVFDDGKLACVYIRQK